MTKARAWILHGPERLSLEEFDLTPPGPDQVLLKLKATSVCASDVKIFHGLSPFKVFPLIMGHELSGEVAGIGSAAKKSHGLKEGDRVTVEPSLTCGSCDWCQTPHHYHKCPELSAYGVLLSSKEPPHLLGGYADFMYLLPGSRIYKLDPKTPHLAGSLSSVIGNGVRWVRTLARMRAGQGLVISGVGSQGLATLIAARELGVGPIMVLGLARDGNRFDLARSMGADFLLAVDREDPAEAVEKYLDRPPEVVVETSGVPEAILTAIDLVRPAGTVVAIGLSGGKETPLVFDRLVAKGLTLVSDHAQAGNYPEAMEILNSGRYPVQKINNFTYPLEELEQALEDTAAPPPGFIKGAILFD